MSPLAREIGQPLLTLSSLNKIDLIFFVSKCLQGINKCLLKTLGADVYPLGKIPEKPKGGGGGGIHPPLLVRPRVKVLFL